MSERGMSGHGTAQPGRSQPGTSELGTSGLGTSEAGASELGTSQRQLSERRTGGGAGSGQGAGRASGAGRLLSGSRAFAGGLFTLGLAFLAAFFLFTNGTFSPASAAEDTAGPNMVIEVEGKGQIVIDLRPDLAPGHVAQIVALAKAGDYDDVAFHRVIEGFMAQTGDVQFGKRGANGPAGTGGSARPNLKAEFTDTPFERGTVGMARAMDPDSANSQFFIMFAPAPHLNGQYTVIGQVIEGMDVVDQIKRGVGQSGAVASPDYMTKVSIVE